MNCDSDPSTDAVTLAAVVSKDELEEHRLVHSKRDETKVFMENIRKIIQKQKISQNTGISGKQTQGFIGHPGHSERLSPALKCSLSSPRATSRVHIVSDIHPALSCCNPRSDLRGQETFQAPDQRHRKLNTELLKPQGTV